MSVTAIKPVSPDEVAILELIAQWSKALENKDLEGMMEHYAPDILLFDIKPPFQTVGIDSFRALWEECLPYFPEKFKSEHRNLNLFVDGNVAYAHMLHHITPIGEKHPAGQTWLRVTVGYRKVKDKWQVVHEHVSIPFDPVSAKVSYITDIQAGAAEE